MPSSIAGFERTRDSGAGETLRSKTKSEGFYHSGAEDGVLY